MWADMGRKSGRGSLKLKISVVTVCLNAQATIEKTITSVLGQTYQDKEYIIVDGMSGDGTQDIIRRYEHLEEVRFLSQKDTGLYNAMNRGIDLCRGDYILFLNSGDVFVDHEVLARVAERAEAELVYGNVIRVFEKEERLEKYPGKNEAFKLMLMGRMPCHQVIFTKREIMEKYRFDESFRICADFDFMVRCLRERVPMQYVDVTVSRVDCVEGVSSRKENLERMRKEDDRSIRKWFPGWYWVLRGPKGLARRFKKIV